MEVLTSKFADDVREAYLDEIRLEQLEKQEGITYLKPRMTRKGKIDAGRKNRQMP